MRATDLTPHQEYPGGLGNHRTKRPLVPPPPWIPMCRVQHHERQIDDAALQTIAGPKGAFEGIVQLVRGRIRYTVPSDHRRAPVPLVWVHGIDDVRRLLDAQ